MAGLLYKDFVAVRGKIYVICAVIVMIVTWILRLMIQTDEAEYLLVMYAVCFLLILYAVVFNTLESDLMKVDEVKKQKQYCISLPITKKEYVAGKYVFMLLVFYLVQSFSVLMGNVIMADCRTNVGEQLISVVMAVLPIITGGIMLVSSVELPFFIGFGYKKGSFVKQVLLEGFFVVFMVYMLFGDLTIFEKFSLDLFVDWAEKHQDIISALHVFVPIVTLGIYYISYRISCVLYERREFSDD